jgi:hypothetical protein
MKKILPLVFAFAVAAIIGAVFFVQKRFATAKLEIPSVLPAETLVLLQLPDFPGTKVAWRQTALRKIVREPDVSAYIKLLEPMLPHFEAAKRKLGEIAKIDPIQAFIAVTDNAPTVIAGIEFAGKRSDVDVLLNELKTKMQEMAPAGRADIAMHAGHEVQMFHLKEKTFAASFHQRWFLIANSVDLLEQTLDSFVASHALGFETLASNPHFRKSVSRMPQNPDALLFVQTGSLIDRVVTLLSVSGQKLDSDKLKELQKVQALAAAMKFEGQNIRDSIFLLKPGEKAGEPLDKPALAFSTAETRLFYTSRFEVPDKIELPDASLDVTGVLQLFKGAIFQLQARGITMKDIRRAFGHEIGSILAWNDGRIYPSFLTILEVRDFEEAKRLLDAAAEITVGGAVLSRREMEGGVFYSFNWIGSSWFPTPSVALSSNYAVIGLSLDDIMAGLAEVSSGTGRGILSNEANFDAASASVITPTVAFAYIDAAALFGRIYRLAKTSLAAWSTLAPPSAPFLDPARLPLADSVTKHLGSIVYSQAEVENGVISESVGTVTLSQSLVAAALGGGAAFYPFVKEQIGQKGTFQGSSGIPGFMLPDQSEPAPSRSPGTYTISPEDTWTETAPNVEPSLLK